MSYTKSNDRPAAPPDSQALTVAEMCATYRISKNRVFDEMNAGRLPAKRVGHRVLINRDDANAWFALLPARTAQRGAA